jgi:hypothetical protein
MPEAAEGETDGRPGRQDPYYFKNQSHDFSVATPLRLCGCWMQPDDIIFSRLPPRFASARSSNLQTRFWGFPAL